MIELSRVGSELFYCRVELAGTGAPPERGIGQSVRGHMHADTIATLLIIGVMYALPVRDIAARSLTVAMDNRKAMP
jgi:hypothetical protein